MPATKSLQELIIAAHFQVPLALTVVDLADWIKRFSDFSIVQQLPALPQFNLAPVAAEPQVNFQMLNEFPLPRILLRTPDSRFSVQLQSDRFAFGWHRTEPVGQPSEYPGFVKTQKLFGQDEE